MLQRLIGTSGVHTQSPNHPAPGKAGMASRLTIEQHCPGVSEPFRLGANDLNAIKRLRSSLVQLVRLVWVLGVLVLDYEVKADIFLSNLDTPFVGGIGDIHGLFPGGVPYGSDTARFTTGSGVGFSVNSITLEFTAVPHQWENVQMQLFGNAGSEFLGSFGSPAINLRSTQWPQETTYVDFSPLASIDLEPLTEYSIVLSVPAGRPEGAALLFAWSAVYTTPTDWTMRSTITDNPYAQNQFLKLAVDATVVPEPSTSALLIVGAAVVIACSVSTDRRTSRAIRHRLSPLVKVVSKGLARVQLSRWARNGWHLDT